MTIERWGTFSVIDHKNAAALVPEVLLYDRLVIPFPPDDVERKRWRDRGWEPELLDRRLEVLGGLAVKASWDLERQKTFREWMGKLHTVQEDADGMVTEVEQQLPYILTRRILAQQPPVLPAGITRVVTVAAYQSEADLKTHFLLGARPAESERATLGFLLAHRFAVPADENPEKALRKAVDLTTKDDHFRENRRKLYAWQEEIVREGVTPEIAIQEMDQMIEAYNRSVERAIKTVYYKYAFTIAGIALGLAGAAIGNPLWTASSLLSIVQFATLDRKPVIEAGENAPAAMFHDVEAKFRKFKLA